MYRVLRPGGFARIQDMQHDATHLAIRKEVEAMGIGGLRALMTRMTLRSLRRRAYTVKEFQRFSGSSPFHGCTIATGGSGIDVTLRKPI